VVRGGKKALTIDSQKIKKKKLILFAVLILLVLGVVGFFVARQFSSDARQQEHFRTLDISTTPISKKERNEHTTDAKRPRYIHIPAVDINQARILALGVKDLDQSGQQQLDVPKSIDDVSWYDCQINPITERRCAEPTLPGGGNTETAAILTGHTCFSRSMSCVFDNISKLKNNDTITIELGDGTKLNYSVRQVETVKLEDVDMAKAMRPIESGKEGITLITCAGTYQGATDANGVLTADKRVLVYAVRVD